MNLPQKLAVYYNNFNDPREFDIIKMNIYAKFIKIRLDRSNASGLFKNAIII